MNSSDIGRNACRRYRSRIWVSDCPNQGIRAAVAMFASSSRRPDSSSRIAGAAMLVRKSEMAASPIRTIDEPATRIN